MPQSDAAQYERGECKPETSLACSLAHAALDRRVVCRFSARLLPGFAGEHLVVQAVVPQLALGVDVAEVGLLLSILFAHVFVVKNYSPCQLATISTMLLRFFAGRIFQYSPAARASTMSK